MDTFKSHVVYRFQDFLLDVRNRKLSNTAGHEIKLSSRAFDTLVELVRHRGETLSKDRLMDTVWHGLVVEENNINQAICLVRKALGDSTGEPQFVKTISGKGFCFVADVQAETAAEVPLVTRAEDPVPVSDAEPTAVPPPSNPQQHSVTVAWLAYWKRGALVAAALLSLLVFMLLDPRQRELGTKSSVPEASTAVATADPSVRNTIADSIAVMPFTNLNENGGNELFARGLHDELINQLAKAGKLKVISRDSVITAAQSGGSLFEIADQLNAESLLTGSIFTAGERARINLQMLNAETGVALWSKSFEVDAQHLSDMISAQGEIALKVAKALEGEARLPGPESLASLPTHSFEAHRYYLTARNSYNHQDEEEKWVLLGKALELDPNYADAHLMFANINLALAVTPLEGFTHEEHLRLASGSVDAYIRLEPESALGYGLKAGVLAARGDWKSAVEQVAVMQQLEPSQQDMKYAAMVKMSLGDFQGAVRIYEKTLIAEPSNLYVRGLLMAAHEMAGNQHGARQEYALGNELKSVWWGRTVNVLLTLGRREPLDPTNTLDDFPPDLRHLLTNTDDLDLLREGIRHYSESGVNNARDDMFYSALAAYSGDQVQANVLLRAAVDKVATSIFWAWLPVFADLRETAEFHQLLADAGLVEHWRQQGWPARCKPVGDGFRCH